MSGFHPGIRQLLRRRRSWGSGFVVRAGSSWRLRKALAPVFSPDGEFLAAGQSDGRVEVYRVDDGTLVARARPEREEEHDLPSIPTGLAFGPRGRVLAGAFFPGTVHVWKMDL